MGHWCYMYEANGNSVVTSFIFFFWGGGLVLQELLRVSWVQSNGCCEWWIYLTSNVYFVLINVIDFHVIGIDMQKT